MPIANLFVNSSESTRNAVAVITHSPEETNEVAHQIAELIRPPCAILLTGALGAGKTSFVRGFLEALGYTKAVRSPTYNILRTYEARYPVAHADLYRVDSLESTGLTDYIATHVMLIEWPEPFEPYVIAEQTWRVTILFDGDNRRIIVEEPKT